MVKAWIPRILCSCLFAGAHLAAANPPAVTHLKKILVLDKSQGGANGHLESRRDLNNALKELAVDKGFAVTFIGQNDASSVIASEFSSAQLATYQAVLFSNNDGVHAQLDAASKLNVEVYVRNGGGLISVHSGQDFIDTGSIRGWPWFAISLVQRFYGAHGSNQPTATLSHDSSGTQAGSETKGIFHGLTAPTAFLDEFYSFHASPRDSAGVTILVTVDEKTFSKSVMGPMGEDHPVVWTKAEGKGQVVNFSLGHSWSTNNVYAAKNGYLKKLLYGTLRFVAKDFTGCTDNTFQEYNPDATRSDASACKVPSAISLAGMDGNDLRPLIARDAGGSLVTVTLRSPGAHSVAMLDVSGRTVHLSKGIGPTGYSLPVPSGSGIYTVIAKSAGKAIRYRVTVL